MERLEITTVVSPNSSFKYIISSSPCSDNITQYIQILCDNNIKTVLRLCDTCEYDEKLLLNYNINVINMPIRDGDTPNRDEINEWIKIVNKESEGIAVHCKAGLGRAPLFVCIGLIKNGGMSDLEAIKLVRKHIKNCLNTKQLIFLCEELNNVNLHKRKNACVIS